MEQLSEPVPGVADNSNMPNGEDGTPPAPVKPDEPSQASFNNLSADDEKYVSDKGWKSPEDVLKSYRELEKSASSKIAIPKADDKDGWNKLYTRLGRPETVDGYTISDMRKEDESLVNNFKEIALTTGLTSHQVSSLYEWFKQSSNHSSDTSIEEFNQKSEKDIEKLKEEWGSDYGRNQELAKRGWGVLSLDEEKLENIEVSVGTKTFMQMGMMLGRSISEDNSKIFNSGTPQSEEMSTEDFIKERLAVARGKQT